MELRHHRHLREAKAKLLHRHHFRDVEMKLHRHCHHGEVEVELHHHRPLEVVPSSFGELEVDLYYHHYALSCNILEMNNPLNSRYWR